jgi:cell division protein FtsQ
MPPLKHKSRKKNPSAFARFAALFERYTIASVAGAMVLGAALLAVLWAGGYFGAAGRAIDGAIEDAAAGAGLRAERVTLRGAHETETAEILAAAGPLIGRSMLAISSDEIRRRVEQLGWVRSAAVSRLYPNTVHISIRERRPAAVWQENNELNLIDENGAVIRPVGAYEYSYLPLIVGSGAPAAASGLLAALSRHAELLEKTSALIRVSGRRWNLRLRNGVEVRLPETGYAEAVDAIALLQAAHGALDQPVEYIDLRDPERMVVKKRDEAAPQAATASR